MIGSSFTVLAQTDSAAPPTPVPPNTQVEHAAAAPGDQAATHVGVDPDAGKALNASKQAPGPGGIDPFTLIMLAGVVLLFVFMFGGQRKEKKKRQAMLAAMAKGDRVQTVGGVLGTITDMKDDEITLKVDENSNTRMRFARNAIQSVVQDKPE